jgi:CubicO group peptidase (beta-lactamase class C family)
MEAWILEMKEKIEEIAQQDGFSGVISIRNMNGAIYQNSFGFRDIKNKLPNTLKTKFGIASGTKIFTALGIGKLIDQGALSLSTEMDEIDIDPGDFIDRNATILQLLTHTSGIYDYYDEEEITDFENFSVEIPCFELTTPTDYLPLFKNQKMKFLPGERYSYSNGGYVLLGIIIERITGQLYRDFIKANVLEPANMYDSGFFAFNDLPENTANGYLTDRKSTNIYILPIRGGGDGGMYTTAEDVNSFWKSLFSYRILSPETTSEYLKTYHKFNDELGYGCGIVKKLNESAYSISGSDAGAGFFSRYVVKDSITATILANITDVEVGAVKSILQFLDAGL